MLRVLTIAAHADDEVLGPGATLARYRAEGAELFVAIVTDSCSTQYPDRPELIPLKEAAARTALDALGGGQLVFGRLPDMRLDTLPLVEVNRFLERVVDEVRPDVVFTHHPGDLNADHRVVFEATVVAARPGRAHRVGALYAYEVLGASDFGGVRSAFAPDTFVDGQAFLGAKLAALRAYDVEMRPFPHPRSLEAVEALGRTRGSLAGLPWAEAFETLRVVR